jgi:hypothetical protein
VNNHATFAGDIAGRTRAPCAAGGGRG